MSSKIWVFLCALVDAFFLMLYDLCAVSLRFLPTKRGTVCTPSKIIGRSFFSLSRSQCHVRSLVAAEGIERRPGRPPFTSRTSVRADRPRTFATPPPPQPAHSWASIDQILLEPRARRCCGALARRWRCAVPFRSWRSLSGRRATVLTHPLPLIVPTYYQRR